MLAIDCPNCSRPLRLDDRCAGQQVVCAHCRYEFEVVVEAETAEGGGTGTLVEPGPPPGLDFGPPAAPAGGRGAFGAGRRPEPGTVDWTPPPPAAAPAPAEPADNSRFEFDAAVQSAGGREDDDPPRDPPRRRGTPPPLPPRPPAGLRTGPVLACLASAAVTLASLTGIVLLLRPPAAETATTPVPTGPAERWAAISIESSGVRLLIVEITPVGDSYQFGKVDTEQREIDFKPGKAGAEVFGEKEWRELDETLKLFVRLAKESQVPPGRVLVAANSGVTEVAKPAKDDTEAVAKEKAKANAAARAKLTGGVKAAVGLPVDHISAEAEARYGALGCVPPDEREAAVALDFGSSGVKIGFNASRRVPDAAFFPFGTRKFTEAVEGKGSALPLPDFAAKAAGLRDSLLAPEVDKLLREKSAVGARKKYHLMGGAAWAVAVVGRPQDLGQTRVRITGPDLDRYLTLVTTRPDFDGVRADVLSRAGDAAARDRVADELRKIEERLKPTPMKFLVAGGHVVKAFADRCQFAGKDVRFFANSLFAWPLGYVLTKANYEK